MATQSSLESFTVWTITAANGAAASIVPELGGIVSSLMLPVGDTLCETLFRQPWFWDRTTERTRGGIPFIFPICGRLERDGQQDTYLYDGQRYAMPIHGFASRKPWRVVVADREDRIEIELTDDETTQRCYPFAFRLRLAYYIENDGLCCEQTYINRGDRPMPLYAGFHPYLLTPPHGQGKESVMLSCEPLRAFEYNARLTDIAGVKPTPAMPVPITAAEINELLIEVREGSAAALLFPDKHRLLISAGGVDMARLFPYLQFYTMADQPFFCVEPWMGHPNALNTVTGAQWLAPGAHMRGIFRCRIG
jgi:galactose mutarotase-like enzyme